MSRSLVLGEAFRHLLYAHGELAAAARVHVYLEGDGLPWQSRHRIASDPTPHNPLALRLMARDPAPALYVGRPCYNGLSRDAGCTPWLWTHGRYGRPVLESMARAIEKALPELPGRRLTLIGYSGGGVIAVLLAERLAAVDQVVTIGANLDIDAWADLHGYSRLTGSINPVERPPLTARIRQLHLSGQSDRQVPTGSIARFLARNPSAQIRVLPGVDHRCCWVDRWPGLMGLVR